MLADSDGFFIKISPCVVLMDEKYEVHGLCLEAFAGISAIATHDLKNTLAIINENAGLLDDLVGMVDESEGVPTDRVKNAAEKVALQVTRSNTIIKNLNRFAHSGDMPVVSAAIADILNLMVALTGRKAAMNSISVTVEGSAELQVETFLFPFESLLYRIFIYIYSNSMAGSSLVLSYEQDDSGLAIRFAVDLQSGDTPVAFPGRKEEVLLNYLKGSLEVVEGAIILTVQQ